ncbi:hypothetical protein LOKVESSMR4R_00029 [Yoonia vestfoldensis]|uniref:YspA cpYpsA-related SLOG domain-containing protein n=2 Tax=Yoonia vestfoldensis TaxID=245188 RepID=A0A1Y0E7B0_9RHOB|nr:DUF2493 domain-containing protein [Yoonia vestfoldensis]ART99377.1 hypothetical protein LOKVESSMR4R_00029 [Yoonia vestfoldensis]
MLTTYDTIEMFGLTENADCLPMPDDQTLRDTTTREAFEALFGPLQGTGLESEIEPLAHGFASLFFRRRKMLDEALTKQTDAARALIRAHDGSEINDTNLSDAQTRADRLRDMRDALDVMAETAARCYEIETGKAFIPAAGSRKSAPAHLTGATFEAREWLEAHERQEAAKFVVDGVALAVAGDRDWLDHAKIWDTLDKIKTRFYNNYGENLILYTKGDAKGVDAIAAAWAKSRSVHHVTFAPNWKAYGKAAGFKAIDQMFTTPKHLGGVAIFGTTGIALNLADKAEAQGIKAMRVKKPEPAQAPNGPAIINGAATRK